MTNRFCAQNAVALIVRSHECVPEGFEVLSSVALLDTTAWTAPTLVGTTLYVRDRAQIVALDVGE